MAGFGDIVQKAVYLGIGIATYASEKASVRLQELRVQAEKLADEMVARGEMTADEARRYVDELVQQAQKDTVEQSKDSQTREPRQIEILSDEEEESANAAPDHADTLRQQVESLQEELRRLKRQ